MRDARREDGIAMGSQRHGGLSNTVNGPPTQNGAFAPPPSYAAPEYPPPAFSANGNDNAATNGNHITTPQNGFSPPTEPPPPEYK